MEPKLVKIFQKSKYEPTANLAENIWFTIATQSYRRARLKLWVFSLLGLASLVGLVPTLKALLTDLTQSGFYEYFSLIFSNGVSVFSYWRELTLSLVESLPIVSIVFTLSLIFISFLSIKHLMKVIINNNTTGNALGIA